jgi:hypothetical protein
VSSVLAKIARFSVILSEAKDLIAPANDVLAEMP